MEAFATTDDLELRWRTLSGSEVEMAEAELADASAFIARLLRKYGVAVDQTDEVQAQLLTKVTCDVVRRSMSPRLDAMPDAPAAPYTQATVTADVFTQSFTFSNPMGDYYLTTAEKNALGIGRMRVRQMQVKVGDDDEG